MLKQFYQYRCYIICLWVLTLSEIATAQSLGTIAGTVRDEKNEPLPGVTIKVEQGGGAVTGIDGSYRINLNAGKYTLTFSYVSFESKEISEVVVKANDITDLSVVMREATRKTSLSEVVVKATYRQASIEGLYNKQKNNSAISDGISSEQIRRTPDNNAAQVLRRVSGITIQDNKFVTVRGMSERYNNVMLNNSMLPSTEPNRRNFSFDIIPSALIDNIIVNKTATPDMPGEFAGGVVQVQTKDIPDKNVVSFATGTGYNTLSAGQPFQSLKRSSSEFMGRPGDQRDWWWGKWSESAYKDAILSQDFKKITDLDKKIPNNWGLYEYGYTPMQQYQLYIGRLINLSKDKGSIGVSVAGTYRNEQAITDVAELYRVGDFDIQGKIYDFTTSASGLANIAYQNKGHKIAFKNLYTKRYTHSTQVVNGQLLGASGINSYTDLINSNDLYQNKLEGDHTIPGTKAKINWSLDRSELKRLQPDTRSSIRQGGAYGLGDASGAFGLTTGGLSVLNAYLNEVRWSYTLNTTIPFKLFGQEQKFKAGGLYYKRNADYTFAGLKYQLTPFSTVQNEIYNRPDYFIADPEFINERGLWYRPAGPSFGTAPEAYTGRQDLAAVYGMLDMKLTENLRFVGGVRMENNRMDVTTKDFTFDGGNLIVRDTTRSYKKTNFLPSLNLIYSLSRKSNVRVAFSQTLARPDFRERSPFLYFDFYEFVTYSGAVGLNDTRTTNIDLRYEYYPKAGEVFTASLFYKKFKNPVELVQQLSSTGAVNFYFNLESSTNYGFETDFRKTLGFISGDRGFLRNLYVSGNFTYMISEVDYNIQKLLAVASGLNPDDVSSNGNRKRPLQGLSPYIINGAIGYQDKKMGAQMSYNRIGPRLITGGPNPFEDQYEIARDVIDLQVSGRFWRNRIEARLNVSDLLQQPFIIYQNAATSADKQNLDNTEAGPKGNNYDKGRDIVRQKNYRGSNISLSIGIQL